MKKITTLLNASRLKVETVRNSSAISVGANGGTAWGQVRIPSDVKPICIVGYYLDGGGGCSVYNVSLGKDSNGYYGSFALRNGQSTTNNVKITAHVLCMVGGVVSRLLNLLAPERGWAL